MTINERLFKTMEQKNIKMAELARELEINKTVISAWRKRKTNPPTEYLEQICELLKISISYLITGKEEIEKLTEEEQNLIDAYKAANPGIQNSVRKLLDLEEGETEESYESRTG